MRDLKFRVFLKNTSKYIANGVEIAEISLVRNWKQYYIVEQYTGLKDKNGKEIYEGDILCCDNMVDRGDGYYDPYIGTVSFDQSQAYYIIASAEPFDGGYGFIDIDECKIIGNIHDKT